MERAFKASLELLPYSVEEFAPELVDQDVGKVEKVSSRSEVDLQTLIYPLYYL